MLTKIALAVHPTGRQLHAWRAHVRKQMRPNAHLAIRHDAWRFMPPGSPLYVGKDVVNYFWPEPEPDQSSEDAEYKAQREWEADLAELLRLRNQLAAIKAELKLRRYLRERKVYNPDQPRVPAGNPDGGQWSGDAGSPTQRRVRLAGPIPTNDPPEIPKERPPTARERNRIGRGIARWQGPVGALLQAIPWLQENVERVDAYRDPAKNLEELQEGASEPKRGYDIHHIVEQRSAEQDGFSRSQIDAPENLVRISTYKHWEITAWYQSKNKDFEGLSPREYLRGKNWDVRTEVGLGALVRFGVLKP